MGFLQGTKVYWKFAGQCTQCGHCTKACESLVKADMSLGQIARALLEEDRAAESAEDLAKRIRKNKALTQAVRGCFFCTSCKNTCFAHNDVCELIYQARVDFQALGLIPRDAWNSVLVDQQWDIFTVYRAVYGIWYMDLTRHLAYEGHEPEMDCETAFFPGCSLAAYAPDLTREIFATIEALSGKTTMIDHCCGSPLKSAGFYDRAEALLDVIADEIVASGAKRVVCVCPGCRNAIEATFARRGINMEAVNLSGFLAACGFAPKHPLPQGEIWLSKSCQDRDGSCLAQTCAALGLDESTPHIYKGCCGAGGAVSAYQPRRQAAQADSKLDFAPDGATVVSMCPTCTYTYAYRNTEVPRDINNKHYTELLFDNQFDWDAVFSQLGGMYSGQYAAWVMQVLA